MSREAFRVAILLLLAAIALLFAFQLPSDVLLDFGPNDRRYAHGFREDFEVDEPTIIHWTTDRSSVTLPFRFTGPFDVTLRYKRHIAAPAEVRLFIADELVATETVPQQDFALLDLHAKNVSSGPFELEILSRSTDPRPLGLALDWMQVRPSRGLGAVVPEVSAMVWMLSWVLAFYLVPRAVGLGWRVASISAAGAAVTLAVLASVNRLWPVHASAALGIRTHVIAALLVSIFVLRQRVRDSAFAAPVARWAIFAVYVGFAIHLFALFHPDFYYPDVRTHSKFVSLIWTEGLDGFFGNYIENQHTHLLGLQLVGDRWLAFPYPPLLYLTIYPLSLLQLPVEEWMMLVPSTLVAVEALLLFALAGKLGVSRNAALFAVLLHASARVIAFRLAVASYAAMYGHFWDTVAIVYLVFFFERIDRVRYAIGFASLVAVSILSYAGSGLVLGLFVPAFCLSFAFLPKQRRPPTAKLVAVAGWSLAGALAAIFSFYWQYVRELVTGPASGSDGADLVEVAFTPLAALAMAAHRLNLFYGGFGFLALAAVFVIRRRSSEPVNPLRAALALGAIVTYVGMNFLPAGFGASGAFQISNNDHVILPVAISFGLLALAAIYFIRRDSAEHVHPLSAALALAAVVTYIGMNFLRAGLGATHIFQFSKDDLVILPAVALALGILLDGSSRRTGVRRVVTALVMTAWVAWGAVSFSRDIRSRFILPDYPPPPAQAAVSFD